MTLLEARDLQVWFDLPHGGRLHAVQGVSFSVEPGERVGLVGESGCGKTTALLALMGLLPPSAEVAGEVYLEGEGILAGGEDSVRPHRWTDVAMVFQGAMNAFDPVKTIGRQLVEPMEAHAIASGQAAEAAAGELLELVGIPRAAAERYPHEFSGGMRQRAAIAMALSAQPKVLLADEPTTALDVMVQAQILRLLENLTRDLELALILVTHDLSLVAQVCDRAAVMYAGRIVEQGPSAEVLGSPAHPYTRALAGAFPVIGDREFRMAPAGVPGDPPDPRDPVGGCPFHPRCAVALESCATTDMALWPAGPARSAACVHAAGAPAVAS